MFNSVHDNYYDYIKKDSGYFRKWLELYGTECRHLTPKPENDRINDIYTAFGDQSYASNQLNYDEHIIHLMIQPTDFTRAENGSESVITVVSPEKLDDGDLIEFRRLNRIYTYNIDPPIESHWDNYYRVNLRLNRVREAT